MMYLTISSEARPVQNLLTKKYGFCTETANRVTQGFLKCFRKCPQHPEFYLHDWRRRLWTNSLGKNNVAISGEIYRKWLNLRYKYMMPSADVISLLKSLRKKYYLAVITNGPSDSQWEKINRLALNQYFQLILVSGDLKWEKPNENIFLEACLHFNLSRERCIMVGDKLETDILGGIKARLGGTIWIPLLDQEFESSESGNEIMPDCVIRNIKQLKSFL